MLLLSRCALIGMPASGWPAADTILPVSSDGPSAASVGKEKAAASATAAIPVVMVSLDFIGRPSPEVGHGPKVGVHRLLSRGCYACPQKPTRRSRGLVRRQAVLEAELAIIGQGGIGAVGEAIDGEGEVG